jgi:ABC-type multidrug transport system ATPase subunit
LDKRNTSKQSSIITVSGLTKKFGRKVVLSDVSLQVNKGDAIAFIGRNGCGKSTLLKIISGVLPFEKGNVIHNGKLRFGYVPERFPPMRLTVRDYISQIASITGLRKEDAEKSSTRLFKRLFMQDMIETPIRYLSKGTTQKVAVVQAFLTVPDVLILDEPVSGQDTTSQREFIDMVNILNREHGVAILCSCHEDYMIRAITRSVKEISKGKIHDLEHPTFSEVGYLNKLLFVSKLGYESYSIPKPVLDISLKTEELNDNEIAIYVTAQNCDMVIREMILNNFELKGLNNERII